MSITVVGASLAGLSTVRALRAEGYDGEIVVVGEERHVPYDRPPLSKDFLGGALDAEDLALGSTAEQAELRAEWRLGESAVRLNPRTGAVDLSDGTRLPADGVVIATGARPNTLPGSDLPGAFVLRTLEDALALRDAVRLGSRVAVVGAGWIGAEVASTCRRLGAQVTVVEALHVPMVRTLGIELAPVCLALHEDNGVRTRCGTAATHVLGTDRVTGVALADGRVVPADVVVVAAGVHPTTGWLRGSGLGARDGVLTDAGGVTRLPNVVAVGDVARYHSAHHGRKVLFPHWTNAMEQPRTAVRNLLAGRTVAHHTAPPQFWSSQYGTTLQFAGYAAPRDHVSVVEGSAASGRFVALYHRSGRPVAVFAMNSPRQFTYHRRRLKAPS